MQYVTGLYALNLPCTLNTWGDWHTSALRWDRVRIADTEKMFFGEYGIERNKQIPEHTERYNVTNHIRALLDLMQMGLFSVAQGMRDDFIGTREYDDEIFEKVYSMRDLENWTAIDRFMGQEYMMRWIRYKKLKEA